MHTSKKDSLGLVHLMCEMDRKCPMLTVTPEGGVYQEYIQMQAEVPPNFQDDQDAIHHFQEAL